jgi:hypothetical protein
MSERCSSGQESLCGGRLPISAFEREQNSRFIQHDRTISGTGTGHRGRAYPNYGLTNSSLHLVTCHSSLLKSRHPNVAGQLAQTEDNLVMADRELLQVRERKSSAVGGIDLKG